MPPITITWTPLSQINPADKNPKQHDIGAICESIKRFGFVSPLLLNETTGKLVAGHGRIEALAMLKASGNKVPKGIKTGDDGDWLVPVVRGIRFDTDEEAEAYLLADNRTVELGGWDAPELADMLTELAEGSGLDGVGWDGDDLDTLLADLDRGKEPEEPPEAQIDKAEELRKKWKVKRGQVWVINSHRLMCGDSTNAEDVKKLLAGKRPNLMVTDPPYGVEYNPEWRQEAAKKGLIDYTARRIGKVQNDDQMDWAEAWALFPGNVAYVWCASSHTTQGQLESSGFEIRNQIIWSKSSLVISRGHYNWQHEPCWYAVRKGKKANWIGDHSQSTIWKIGRDENTPGGHGTQKPLECMARPIRNHSGDVYDPFLGSGTTMIAAENIGRKCYGMEIDPGYCGAILERMADLGAEPRREGD